MSGGEGPEEHASFLCVWSTGSIHDFLLGTLPEPATVIESNRIEYRLEYQGQTDII